MPGYREGYTIDRPLDNDQYASSFVSGMNPWRFTLDVYEAMMFDLQEAESALYELRTSYAFGALGEWDYHYRILDEIHTVQRTMQVVPDMSEINPEIVR